MCPDNGTYVQFSLYVHSFIHMYLEKQISMERPQDTMYIPLCWIFKRTIMTYIN